MIFIHHLLSGTWYPVSTAVVSVKDVNGKEVNVGDNVSIKGKIVALSPVSNTLGDALVSFRFGPERSLSVSTLNLVKE